MASWKIHPFLIGERHIFIHDCFSVGSYKPILRIPVIEGGMTIPHKPSLKLTAKAPENGWLEHWFPFGARPIFMGGLLVLGSFRDF